MTPAIVRLAERLETCRGILVDSNVLLDVATSDKVWGQWSEAALAQCAECTTLFINPIIYAEVSIGYTTIEALEAALAPNLFQREHLPWQAGFLAGRCFLQYRRRGGRKTSPLSDFYIGAHAAISRLAILTRDTAGYRSYFPRLEILSPSK